MRVTLFFAVMGRQDQAPCAAPASGNYYSIGAVNGALQFLKAGHGSTPEMKRYLYLLTTLGTGFQLRRLTYIRRTN